MYSANYPDIYIDNIESNPKLKSTNTNYEISFYFTKENKYDFEEYEQIILSTVSGFRHRTCYSNYKSYLYSIGMDKCINHPFIDSDVAELEMHHCILTVYDVATLLAEYLLNTIGGFTEFDLRKKLIKVHEENRVPIVFLCKTCHQLYHYKYLYIRPDQIFGKWWELLDIYKKGWTRELLTKVIRYLNRSLNDSTYTNNEYLLKLRDNILDWSNIKGVELDYG